MINTKHSASDSVVHYWVWQLRTLVCSRLWFGNKPSQPSLHTRTHSTRLQDCLRDVPLN